MSDTIKHLTRHLHGVITMQEIAEKGGWLGRIRDIQAWQCKRLLWSHQKSYQDPNCQPAMHFFVTQLYGPVDFSQRLKDIARVAPKVTKLMPEGIMQALTAALKLNELTFELDFQLAKQLQGQTLNKHSYLAAYQACNNIEARQHQINLIAQLGKNLNDLLKKRGLKLLLVLSRQPAKLAGFHDLHQFALNGYTAFGKLQNVNDFIRSIVHVEQNLMLQMFDHRQANPLVEV